MSELISQPISIQSVYAWYSEDKLYVNRRYQRKLVWTLIEKQKLIESILKKYPIPAILIAEREATPGTYEIIDGLQRLHAILSFIETSFSTLDDKLFNLAHFTTAKSRADEGTFIPNSGAYLSQRDVSIILDYSLALSVMRNATELEVNDVFDRINTYGHRLSDQERRQAGVQNAFSELVRTVACTIRGDATDDLLPLKSMPSISIDMPMTRHGYAIHADEVFWVTQGILRSTDLRDSMDEQCIADIASCIVGGTLIERSKDALDEIYTPGTPEANRVLTALEVYGSTKFAEEFKYCVDKMLLVCNEGKSEKLRKIVFETRTTNPFPSIFAILVIAFHELIVRDGKIVADLSGTKKAITNLGARIETSRTATSPDERRKNINTIKGLIGEFFVKAKIDDIYGNHATTDIDSLIRRSETELSDYELKQGLLTLSGQREINTDVIPKVARTLCAMANNGPTRTGKVVIGVTDKDVDAGRIKALDGIQPKQVGKRFVVGVVREAKVLGLSVEDYLAKWKNGIRDSGLSPALGTSVLSHIDYNAYYGLGVIVITVPPQKEVSYVGEDTFWRVGDATEKATTAKDITSLAGRF